MKISVVIPTYRRPNCLRRCLTALASQRRPADEIVVVSQGDDVESSSLAHDLARRQAGATAWVSVHVDEPNIARAENAGVATARGDVVAFIDDDATADRDWLRRLERWYDDPEVGGAGGPYIEHHGGESQIEYTGEVGTFKWYGRYVSRQWCLTDESKYVDVLSGSNMSFRRALVPAIPASILPYWNAFEVFLSGAVRRQGFKIVFDPAIRVNHYPEERERLDRFAFCSESERQRTLARNSAHNFVYAVLSSIPVIQMPIFLTYDILVGNRCSPGFVRALLLLAEGRRREFAERFGPAIKGKLLGVRTYLKSRVEGRHNDGRG